MIRYTCTAAFLVGTMHITLMYFFACQSLRSGPSDQLIKKYISAGKFQFPTLPFTKELCYVISISKHHDFVVLHRTAAAVASKMTMSSSYEFDIRFAIFAKSRKRVQHLSSVLACHFTYCAKLSPTYCSGLA